MKNINLQFHSNIGVFYSNLSQTDIQIFSLSEMSKQIFFTLLLLIIDEKTDAQK